MQINIFQYFWTKFSYLIRVIWACLFGSIDSFKHVSVLILLLRVSAVNSFLLLPPPTTKKAYYLAKMTGNQPKLAND